MTALQTALRGQVQRAPGATAKELARGLRQQGFEVSKKSINPLLYSDPFFVQLPGSRPRWVPAGRDRSTLASTAGTPPESTARPETSWKPVHEPALVIPRQPIGRPAPYREGLWPWQVAALDSWFAAGCRGVVEAVTGAGKTRIGLEAVRLEVERGGQALVLVPTAELQAQWSLAIETWAPDATVTRLGGGYPVPRRVGSVVVAIVNTAMTEQGRKLLSGTTLLVADETHRYGSRAWAKAFPAAAERRLGLTATYERADDGLERRVTPYLGGRVYDYGYDAAKRDQVISPFVVALLGVNLLAAERADYDAISEEMSTLRQKLAKHIDPRKPMLEEYTRLAGHYSPIGLMAKRYLKLRAQRLGVLAASHGKKTVVSRLVPLLAGSKALLFTEQKQTADAIAEQISTAGVVAAAIHSGVDKSERALRLSRFKEGQVRALVAPRVLDEGVDVPEADLAIVLSATLTKRQMIQRMGRVLRKQPGKTARFVLVYARDTVEDPDNSAHEGFLDMVRDVAEDYRTFPDVDQGLFQFLGAIASPALPAPTPRTFQRTALPVHDSPRPEQVPERPARASRTVLPANTPSKRRLFGWMRKSRTLDYAQDGEHPMPAWLVNTPTPRVGVPCSCGQIPTSTGHCGCS